MWASKYFSLNDPFEFNGMYLDEEKISASGNDVETFYEYWKYIIEIPDHERRGFAPPAGGKGHADTI